MHRIAIVGPAGAGKTTFGKTLARRLGYTAVDLDDLWAQRHSHDFRELVRQSVQGEKWVLIGNYPHVHDLTKPRADTVIWLHYSYPLVFFRLLKRAVISMLTNTTHPDGTPPKLHVLVGTEGHIAFHIRNYRRHVERFRALRHKNPHNPAISFLEFNSPRHADDFLASMPGTENPLAA